MFIELCKYQPLLVMFRVEQYYNNVIVIEY